MRLSALAAVCLTAAASPAAPTFEQHWQDGQAEISGYRLTVNRYGEPRLGQAVMIYVTEPFSTSQFVKVDDAAAAPGDTFEALKLNLIRDFQTGVYDYNTMVSVFTRSADFSPVKITCSVAEWCGHVFEEMRFHVDRIETRIASYFQGESAEILLDPRPDAVAEDALFIQLRGLRGPRLEPGETEMISLIESAFLRRLHHRALHWEEALLTRREGTVRTEVPAGEFDVTVYELSVPDQPPRTYFVEEAYPHRIIRYEFGQSETLELTGTARMPYWELNGAGDESHLEAVGLQPLPR